MTQKRTETRAVRLEPATPDDAGPLAVVAALAFYDDRKWMPEPLRDELLAADDPPKGPPHTSYEWTRRVIDNLNVRGETGSTYYKAVLGDDLVARFAERTHVEATFHATHPGQRLPVPVENELLRILQEALNNVDRHAKADHVEVDWNVDGGNYELVVTDDGRGFDADRAIRERSYGVVGMRERAEVIGASFDLSSQPGVGTCLRVSAGRVADDRQDTQPGDQR